MNLPHTINTYIFAKISSSSTTLTFEPPKRLRCHPNRRRHCPKPHSIAENRLLCHLFLFPLKLAEIALCRSMYSTWTSHQLFSPSQTEPSSPIQVSLLGSNPTTRSLSLQICFSFTLTLSIFIFISNNPNLNFKAKKK